VQKLITHLINFINNSTISFSSS